MQDIGRALGYPSWQNRSQGDARNALPFSRMGEPLCAPCEATAVGGRGKAPS